MLFVTDMGSFYCNLMGERLALLERRAPVPVHRIESDHIAHIPGQFY